MSGYKRYDNMRLLQEALSTKDEPSAALYALKIWYVYASVKAKPVTPHLSLVEYADSRAFIARCLALLNTTILDSVYNALRIYETTYIEGTRYYRIAPYTIVRLLHMKGDTDLVLKALEEWTMAHGTHDATGHMAIDNQHLPRVKKPAKSVRGQKLVKPRQSAKIKK
jgi:hypothetical protein